MRVILTILWAIALFVFTCSVNFQLLISEHVVEFHFNSSPDWSEMLQLDFQWYSKDWILRKIGHFIGFLILTLLAFGVCKRRTAFYWCVAYAMLTEVLQLFFFRGGRIYDVINDSLGVLLAYLLTMISRQNGK